MKKRLPQPSLWPYSSRQPSIKRKAILSFDCFIYLFFLQTKHPPLH